MAMSSELIWSSFIMFWLFYIGAILGSFIHVVVSRTLAGRSWTTGRSKCDRCHYQLSWYDNIPLLSFIFLGGKCRKCRKPIASMHFWAEVLSGLVMIWWWLAAGQELTAHLDISSLVKAGVYASFGWVGLVIVLVDLKKMIVPDRATLAIFVLAGLWLLWRFLTSQIGFDTVVTAIASGLVTLAVFGAIVGLTKGRGMGWGDLKLAPALALFVGWPLAFIGLLFAVWSGALVGVVLLLSGRARRGQPIPFAPFLIFGYDLALLVGHQAWQWYWTWALGA